MDKGTSQADGNTKTKLIKELQKLKPQHQKPVLELIQYISEVNVLLGITKATIEEMESMCHKLHIEGAVYVEVLMQYKIVVLRKESEKN